MDDLKNGDKRLDYFKPQSVKSSKSREENLINIEKGIRLARWEEKR